MVIPLQIHDVDSSLKRRGNDRFFSSSHLKVLLSTNMCLPHLFQSHPNSWFYSFLWNVASCIQFSKFCQSHICQTFFKFQVCTTYICINYGFILSKSLIALIYTSLELSCGTLIIKIKTSICACSTVSRLSIYASNKPLCGTLIINIGKNLICACYYKQVKTRIK